MLDLVVLAMAELTLVDEKAECAVRELVPIWTPTDTGNTGPDEWNKNAAPSCYPQTLRNRGDW